MAHKRSKPARANGSGSEMQPMPTACILDYPIFPVFIQEPIDVVGLLAARSGVAASTVRAHLVAFGIEARS